MRPKLVQRNNVSWLSQGTRVVMSDGWKGRIESNFGGIVACLADGASPDPHWAGAGYRLCAPRLFSMNGSTAEIVWKSAATARRPTVNRERRDAILLDFAREKLERSWESSPGG
jgi:hypothetical protein